MPKFLGGPNLLPTWP